MIDTSLFVAGGTDLRELGMEAVVKAARHEVFRTLTTAEGWRAFFETESRIDLEVGGRIEILFLEDAAPGGQGSEGCQFLSYVPDEMVSFTWNAPPHLPGPRGRRTWVVITLWDEAGCCGGGGGGTRVSLRHLGFGEGAEWDECLEYFERAWGKVLEALAGHMESRRK